MPSRAKKVVLGRQSVWDSPPEWHTRRYRSTTVSEEPLRTLQIDQILRAIDRSIPLDDIEFPEEFFPAHLPVALVDAVFRYWPGRGEQPALPADRYCRRFGVARRRTDSWELLDVAEQETLTDLIGHYDALGVDSIADEVFRSRSHFPGTAIGRAEYVRKVAHALRGIGVEVLQDIQARYPEAIDEVLGPLPGSDEHFVRRLLVYTGNDDFVREDESVRRFVARALGQETISAALAASLVRESAYELVLSPRYLDYRIWRHDIALIH